jgi:transposase
MRMEVITRTERRRRYGDTEKARLLAESAAPGARDIEANGMIALAPFTKVYLATKPVSMRYGFDGLAALAGRVFKADPYSGHLFVFRSKSAGYFKALYGDGSGLCLFAKRLERGRFVWPPLVDGMDGQRTVLPPASKVPMQA